MRTSHAIAAWMCGRLHLDTALAGDLLEERAQGRSTLWYWRQVLIAIWLSIWHDIRNHKGLALRAVATGFAIEYLFIYLWMAQGPDLPLSSTMNWIANLTAVLLTQFATGWVVARTHRKHPIPMVFAFLVSFVSWWFGPKVPWATRMARDWNLIDPAYRPLLPYFVTMFFLTVVCVLIGGIVGGSTKSPSSNAISTE